MIVEQAESKSERIERQIFWPGNKTFAVCLTHDVDRVNKTYQYITRIRKRDFLGIPRLFGAENPYWCFPTIMNVEEKFDVRSTFFFLQESKRINLMKPGQWVLSTGKYKFNNRSVSEIIKTLHSNGWEIGLHGSYDSFKNKDLLRDEKMELEHVLGAEVTGIRQHYLQLEIPKTWNIQHKAGFLYDASFGFRDRIGFRDERYRPFHPLDNSFLEIPLALMDGALFKNNFNTDAIWGECLNLIKTAERKGALLNVLWHQRVFNDNDFPGWRDIYTKFLKECTERGAYFGTCKDIYDLVVKNE